MRSFWFHTLSYILAFLAAGGSVHGGVLFSSLQETIAIGARIQSHNATSGVVKAGEDMLIISWALKTGLSPSVSDDYIDVKLKFCYAPYSQKDRGWRKTEDDLHKDNTCQVDISSHPWHSAVGNVSAWPMSKDIPGGIYFVRIYATDRHGKILAYGQTTDRNKTTNLITIEPFSGRNPIIDAAAVICSVLSVGTVIAFFLAEKVHRKRTTPRVNHFKLIGAQ